MSGEEWTMLAEAVTEKNTQFVSLDANGRVQVTPKLLFGMDRAALTALAEEAREPSFRGGQLADAIYHQWVTSIEEVTTLPRSWRERMAKDGWEIRRPA